MKWLKKVIASVEAGCEKFDRVVGTALLKTEQKITGGFTFDEEVEYAAERAAPVVKKAASSVGSTAKKAYDKASDKASPAVKKAGELCGRAVEKARALKKGAPCATVVVRPASHITPITHTVISTQQLLDGLHMDEAEAINWIIRQLRAA